MSNTMRHSAARITRSYGGKCPICGYGRLLMQSGSKYSLEYDACAKCGFGYGGSVSLYSATGEQLWPLIVEGETKTLALKGFPATRDGYRQYLDSLPPDTSCDRESVFAYPFETIVQTASKLGVINLECKMALLG